MLFKWVFFWGEVSRFLARSERLERIEPSDWLMRQGHMTNCEISLLIVHIFKSFVFHMFDKQLCIKPTGFLVLNGFFQGIPIMRPYLTLSKKNKKKPLEMQNLFVILVRLEILDKPFPFQSSRASTSLQVLCRHHLGFSYPHESNPQLCS